METQMLNLKATRDVAMAEKLFPEGPMYWLWVILPCFRESEMATPNLDLNPKEPTFFQDFI